MTMPDRIPAIIEGMEDLATEIRALRATADHQKTLVRLAYVVIALMLIVGAWFMVESFWPNTPLMFKSVAVAEGQSVTGPLVYTPTYCRYNSGSAMVSRNLLGVDGNHFDYTFVPVASIAHNGCGSASIALPLPPGVHPGTYVLTIQAAFVVHTFPYRVVPVRATSNQFTLVP